MHINKHGMALYSCCMACHAGRSERRACREPLGPLALYYLGRLQTSYSTAHSDSTCKAHGTQWATCGEHVLEGVNVSTHPHLAMSA